MREGRLGKERSVSPTQRSLDKWRKLGYSVCVVEKWVPASPAGFKGPIITRDAFNFGDLLACKVGVNGALLVQTTSGANVSARVQKIRGISEAEVWLAAGNRIVVDGWRKVGPRGKRKLWECREIVIMAEKRCNKCGVPLHDHEVKAWENMDAAFCNNCS